MGSVGAHILERLHEHGLRRIYGYPGDGINGILGAFHEWGDRIEFIQLDHHGVVAIVGQQKSISADERHQRADRRRQAP
jgi:thiamine pyrophosphate-dependent acetolactate synthase large subunit-like protein